MHLIMEFMKDGVGTFIFAGLTMFAVFCPLMVLVRLATEFPPEKRALWVVPLSIALTLVPMWALLSAVS